jgi:two-component system NtrC family response regulator
MDSIKSEPNQSSTIASVLFADDDEAATRAMMRSLTRLNPDLTEPFAMQYISDPSAVIATTKKLMPEVVVLDLSIDESIGPESGLELIPQILEIDPTIRVIILTGHSNDEFGVRSLELGAGNFLGKPADPKHLHALILDAIAFANLKRKYRNLASSNFSLVGVTGLDSKNSAMQQTIEGIAYAASNNQPVLLIGETGTGKGVLAQAVHRIQSTALNSRRGGPFIRFQPGYGSVDLVVSELFGHQRGAFTGASEQRKGLVEEANGGTLFIDEIDSLSHEVQVMLLNVLQEKVFRRVGLNKEIRSDFRLITAMNQPVEKVLAAEKLRLDFYHRIAHCTITIPPLRERKEDLNDLAEKFLRELTTKEKLQVQGFTSAATAKLYRHNWPGNIRELQACVEGGIFRARFNKRRYVEPEDLLIQNQKKSNQFQSSNNFNSNLSFRERVDSYEESLIREALEKSGGNQSEAARLLQLDRTSFRRILSRIN